MNGPQRLTERHLPHSQSTAGHQQPRKGFQHLTKRHLPPSQPARTGPSDPARGPRGSPKDTCHLHNARTGTSNPAQHASGSPNDTYHLPNACTGPSTSSAGSQQLAKRHLSPSQRSHGPQRPCAGFHPNAKQHLPPSQHAHWHQRRAKRHQPLSQCTLKPQARTGSQRLAKQYQPPSQRARTGPSDPSERRAPAHPVPVISDSPIDTYHLPNASMGRFDPARRPSSLAKRHIPPSERTDGPQHTQCRSSATRQSTPTTFPTRAWVAATQRGFPAGSPNDTYHLHNTRTGTSNPAQGFSSSPNDTHHLPKARTGPSTPSAGSGQARQTTPATFSTHARAPVNLRGDRPPPKSTPTTFPMHTLGIRHLPPVTFPEDAQAPATPTGTLRLTKQSVGYQRLDKRNLPPSQRMHGPQRNHAGSQRLAK
ncbi:UNVERIFIED_CONTAM: hypothetical protein FKN15_026784 [Acipenser sinensis]